MKVTVSRELAREILKAEETAQTGLDGPDIRPGSPWRKLLDGIAKHYPDLAREFNYLYEVVRSCDA